MGQTHKQQVTPEVTEAILSVGLVQNKYNPNLWHDENSGASYHTMFVLWAAQRKGKK
jgi:hypothetical protein